MKQRIYLMENNVSWIKHSEYLRRDILNSVQRILKHEIYLIKYSEYSIKHSVHLIKHSDYWIRQRLLNWADVLLN